MTDPRHEVSQVIQAAPSVGAILIWLMGKPIEWWAAALGMVFIAVQLGYVAWKWRRDVLRERARIAAAQLAIDQSEDDA
jgi:hypothetical protein